MARFADRTAAGRELGALLVDRLGAPGADRDPIVVVGLPRGGVPVAAEVALLLDAPLDVIVVRKLGLPSRPEVAMGALGEDGARVLNAEIIELTTSQELARVERVERAELDRRVPMWRAGRAAVPLAGRVVVVVDDGIATGATAGAACRVARARSAARVVLAAPVASREAVTALGKVADEVVVVVIPDRFAAVGQWYSDFTPTSDEAVTRLLR